jgi:hypothetical protein
LIGRSDFFGSTFCVFALLLEPSLIGVLQPDSTKTEIASNMKSLFISLSFLFSELQAQFF